MDLYRTMTGQSTSSQRRAHQVETNASNADVFAGHLNHLNDKQEAALTRFKSTLHEKGLWKPGANGVLASHDDATLLRYLRARKFEIAGAVNQFADTEKWMKENQIEDLYEHFDVDFYERARKLYPQWTGHRDRRGIPVYVYLIKPLDAKNINAYTKEAEKYKASLPHHKNVSEPAKMLPLFALYHNLLNFVLPMCSALDRPYPEVPVTNSNNIVDISGVGLKQFWNLKAHMQDASVLATAHYPETLDRIFIIGAPSFFPTVWGWIKRWFDPVTVSKIFILGHHEVKSTLTKYIAPEDLPKKYGGTLDWDWGETPHMDADALAIVEKDGRTGWVDGPCLWLDGQRLAVGSEKGKPRRDVDKIAAAKKAGSLVDEHVAFAGVAAAAAAKPTTHASHADNSSLTTTSASPKNVSTSNTQQESQPPVSHEAPKPHHEAIPAHLESLTIQSQPSALPKHLEPVRPPLQSTLSTTPTIADETEPPRPVYPNVNSQPAYYENALKDAHLAPKSEGQMTNGTTNSTKKPHMDRFVTAAEGLPKVNGAI